MGDCVVLSMNEAAGRSYEGCGCDNAFNYVCESADEIEFSCPDDGFFASAPCSDLWYNCWGGNTVILLIIVQGCEISKRGSEMVSVNFHAHDEENV